MKFSTILVIDDSSLDLLIANDYLEAYSDVNEIICVGSALQGLEFLLLKENSPNELPEIIFLDIRMPVMDGFGFLEKFNELSSKIKQQSKIFVLSSSVDPADVLRAKNSPFVLDFIEKPLSEEKILAMTELFEKRG